MRKSLSKSQVKERIDSSHYYIVDTNANRRVLHDRLEQTRIIVQYHNGQVLGGIFESEFF